MITSIEYLETTIPQGGSGTGYSEPDKFKVTFDDGSTDVMSVDIWYLPKDRIAYALVDALREIGVIAAGELWNDVFRMYLHALPKNRRPGFWDELIAQTDGEVEQPEPKADKPQFNLPPELQGKKFRIRKLTPRECFRLMGVDDEDIDKIQAAGISNYSQYKLAGNSIVVDNLFHIFRKMFIERGPDAQCGGQMSIFSSMDDGEEVYYTKGNPLRVVTLCSGYDSQCLALERLKREYPAFDYELIAWSEFDPESKRPLNQQPAVIAHNALFPQWADRNLGDMTKIDWTQVPDFDLLFYSTPCFVAGTLVLTSEGYKPIEEIRVGDEVLTHKNRFKPVLEVGKKPAGEIIKIRSMMFDEIFCTPNHPFLTRRRYRYGHEGKRMFKAPEWKQASTITKDDFLGLAINTKSELPNWEGTTLHRGTHWDAVNELSKYLSNPSFWYLMGRYIGDGWYRNTKTHKAIIIACCERNEDSLLYALADLGWTYTLSIERTCDRVTIYGKELCEFVNRFGRYAHGKHIDAETMNLPCNLLAYFLQGYVDSDGCFSQNEYKVTMVSRELAYGLMQIIAKVHRRPSRIYKSNRPDKCVIEGRVVNQRNTYSVIWHTDNRKQDNAFYEDGYVWFPIKEITPTNRKEFVYNMEVDEDNSYTANGAIVHNCQSISAAGLQHGFVEGSGTRSSIIWNVRDALKTKHPKYACLENVKAMVSKKFLPMFNLWQNELSRHGYTNHPQVMNAKDYGVPQNRERIFLVSILGENQPYNFPAKMQLELRLKDVLQPPEEVDEKCYLSDKMLEYFQRVDEDKSHGHNFNPSDGGGQCLRDKDGTRPAGGRQLCQGRVNSSQDGVVVSPDGISPCHSAGHGNQPKVIE